MIETSSAQTIDPKTAEVLIRVYDQKDNARRIRLRALSALAYFPSQQTRVFLKKVATSKTQPELYNRRAILAMAHAFGPSVSGDLLRILQSDRIEVRRAAATCLARMKPRFIQTALDKHLTTERNQQVVDAAIRARNRQKRERSISTQN